MVSGQEVVTSKMAAARTMQEGSGREDGTDFGAGSKIMIWPLKSMDNATQLLES